MPQFFSTTVAAPGTPQRVTKTDTPAQAAASGILSGLVTPRGTTFIFQASAGNTAAKSIFVGGPSMNVGALTGIGFALLPGASIVVPIAGAADAADFYIDTDSVATTEKVFVTVI